jgi:hypothetical protein
MHETKTPSGFIFWHNGDYSGDVEFILAVAGPFPFAAKFQALALFLREAGDREEFLLPCVEVHSATNRKPRMVPLKVADVSYLVAQRIRAEEIERLENMDTEELVERGQSYLVKWSGRPTT